MADQPRQLPEECWELVFNSFDHHSYLEPLSLVSHGFLSITNHLRYTLTITEPALPFLPQLLRRFPNLKKFRFQQFLGDLSPILHQISLSGLDLESLCLSNQKSFPLLGLRSLGSKARSLKELICFNVFNLQDADLIEIGNSFPFLEVLDISYPDYYCGVSLNGSSDTQTYSGVVGDHGVIYISSTLKRLRKINLSGNPFLTDHALVALSSNCLLLTEIEIRHCDFITQKGIGLAMRNSANLKCISANGIGVPSIDSFFKDSFFYVRALCELDLSHSFLSDEFLCSIGEACLPLKKLVLSHCYCLSFAGISFLLSKHQSLVYLDLQGANFLTDEHMAELTKFLGNLTFINLGLCSKLTNATFFNLTTNCPLLNTINMERTNLGVEEFSTEVVVQAHVKSLFLSGNNSLNDECIKKVAYVCPNLEVLDLACCFNLTEEGIIEILKGCQQIRSLEINVCREVKNLQIDFEVPRLEVLKAQKLIIDDEALAFIGKRCPRLSKLDLKGCFNVTAKGVKEVILNCRALKELNLRWCDNVRINNVAWMVCSRPSLRKIIVPPCYLPGMKEKDFLLRHGCLVCEN
ncbi:hypothetical protein SLE2022_381060 [Rubroshorea leprosula]